MDRWSHIALVPLLVAGIVLLGSPAGTARAERLRTEVVLERTDAHAQLESVVSRSEVRARLAALGVRPEEARARIAALSDAEARAIAERLDQLPAGGDPVGAIVGAMLLVFLVLLLTDLLGLTDVYPFVRKRAEAH